MNRNLLIVGAGQYGQVAKEIAVDMGIYETIDFLDDTAEEAIGKISDMEKFALDYQCAIVAIGNPQVRMKLLMQLKENGYTIAVLVHPKAYVSSSSQVAPGCIIEPMAVIQAGCVLNSGVIVSAGAIVNHNSLVMEGCHLDIGSMVKARSCVPAERKLEAGEVYGETGESGQLKKSSSQASEERRILSDMDDKAQAEDDDWIRKQIKKNGKEPNLFDGV